MMGRDGDQNRGTCDPSRHVEDVQTPLEQAGYDDVLNAMNLRWSRAGGNNPGMWADEWNSHGACMSSLRPSCYASEKDKDRGVVDFFATVMALSDSRPTYDWLFNDGISPTWNYQFGLVQFTRPLENGHGAPVTAQCDRWGVLKSVQYFFELDGCFPYGRFRPVAPASGWHEGCGESVGITYRPKTNPPRNAEELKEWERTRHKPSKKNKAFTIILHKRDMTEPMTTIAPTLMPSERDTLLA